jgi:3'(2'), 5'-bisphosphate nucleotidase
VASRSHRDYKTTLFLDKLDNPEAASMRSSLKFMMLAEGKTDVYPRFAPTME